MGSTDYTPLTAKHIKEKGTFFRNHFVTTALCCPSRVSLWTGRQAHNTNVTDVRPPYGGYPKFVERGFNDNFLPIWLQEAGYNTYYTGKLFNSHTVTNYDKPHVAGFTGSDFLLDPYTYDYLNSTYQRNHDPPVSYEGRHTTEVITEKALGLLDDALEGEKPFFLAVAPIAPHSNVNSSTFGGGAAMTEAIPLDKHKDLFPDAEVPRTGSFNTDEPSGVSWIRDLPLQNQAVIDYNDHFYRQRLRALQGVDELVESLVMRLEESDQLDNTYIIYTSDNGFHIGQHRLPPGKSTGFDEDIRVPFYIRGPGVPEGEVQDAVTTHIDLAPTFFDLAGIPLRKDFDGTPMPVHNSIETTHEHVTVEYWGKAFLEGEKGGIGPGHSFNVPNNTYKSVRIIGDGYDLYYSVFCTNEHELYDLTTDPYEMNNLYSGDRSQRILGYSLEHVASRLDSLLLILKSCEGRTCIKPWNVLHPDGSVQTLRDALDSQYNTVYQATPNVAFDRCENGYILDVEGPQADVLYRDGLSWELWT